jgi:hypothetical protein
MQNPWKVVFMDFATRAERVGFEPTIQFPVYNLSRVARSATLTPLRKWNANLH